MRYLFISCVLILVLSLAFFGFSANNLREGFIRLHIIANSDSEEDQTLKLHLRDKILEEYSNRLALCESREEAEKLIISLEGDIEQYSKNVVSESGYSYSIDVTFDNEYYPTREYENVTLPSGDYLSLRVIIGEGEGKNWWCVLFPPLCVSSALGNNEKNEEDAFISAGFSPEQYKIISGTEDKKYVLKFKIIELIGKIIK